MVNIQNVSKRFGKIEVVKSVNLQLEKGQLLSLIGPNGSGKTTLIKTLLGLVHPSSGSIFIDRKNIKNQTAYREHIGYMPQMGRFPENMKVYQLFELLKSLRKVPVGQLDLDLYHRFEIKSFEKKALGELSGGMRQKVSAALAFMFQPQILILDEPTAGLDPISSEIFKDKIIMEHKQDKLIIITSHILSDIEDITTHVAYMQDGRLEYFGTMIELLRISSEKRLGKAIAYLMNLHQNQIIG